MLRQPSSMRLCALSLVCFGTVFAQNLSFGIAGGGAPTGAFESTVGNGGRFYSPSADYLIGPTVEYHLPRGFSIEADALFRELHASFATGNRISPTPVITWELPVLAKYRLHWSRIDPFVESGPAFRTTGNLNTANPSHFGFAAGAGIATHWRALEIAPAVRYTRWARDSVPSSGQESRPDQIEVLLGISGRSRSIGNPLGSRFALGAIAGVTLTHDLSNGSVTFLQRPSQPGALPTVGETLYLSGADVFLAGPALEMALSRQFYIEADAVYHPIRYDSRPVLIDGMMLGAYSHTAASTWELPVLAKYKFSCGRFRPFAEAGPPFRLPVDGISTVGFSAGGGVEIRWRVLKIAPAIRYTRWSHSNSFEFGSQQLQPNQVEFLTGFLL